jgi:hypothetical protein
MSRIAPSHQLAESLNLNSSQKKKKNQSNLDAN